MKNAGGFGNCRLLCCRYPKQLEVADWDASVAMSSELKYGITDWFVKMCWCKTLVAERYDQQMIPIGVCVPKATCIVFQIGSTWTGLITWNCTCPASSAIVYWWMILSSTLSPLRVLQSIWKKGIWSLFDPPYCLILRNNMKVWKRKETKNLKASLVKKAKHETKWKSGRSGKQTREWIVNSSHVVAAIQNTSDRASLTIIHDQWSYKSALATWGAS